MGPNQSIRPQHCELLVAPRLLGLERSAAALLMAVWLSGCIAKWLGGGAERTRRRASFSRLDERPLSLGATSGGPTREPLEQRGRSSSRWMIQASSVTEDLGGLEPLRDAHFSLLRFICVWRALRDHHPGGVMRPTASNKVAVANCNRTTLKDEQQLVQQPRTMSLISPRALGHSQDSQTKRPQKSRATPCDASLPLKFDNQIRAPVERIRFSFRHDAARCRVGLVLLGISAGQRASTQPECAPERLDKTESKTLLMMRPAREVCALGLSSPHLLMCN